MSEKRELRRAIKKDAKEKLHGNRGVLILGSIIEGIVTGSEAVGVGLLLAGPMAVGLHHTALKAAEGQKNDVDDIFKGFSWFVKSLCVYLLKLLKVFLWSLLFCIPGIIKSYAYSMAEFIVRDNPELSASEVLRKSQEMMKGHKWEFFVLQLSYIGWMLLSALTFGILLLVHVGPWMYVAKAEFYQKIKG